MTRVAIVGGGISGLTAAYELEKARRAGAPLDWHLFEATDRLGGTLETTRIASPKGEYILEGGPDGWVTEKPWARELASELGLGDDLIYSNDATRKTHLLLDGALQPIPDGLRLMVPDGLHALAALESSPLLSDEAKRAYSAEPRRAEELKRSAPHKDESIASFVRRHFGEEVLAKLAAPLLSGVFGGDVDRLSVRAVMPQFVHMEQEHGSLILALEQAKRDRAGRAQQPIFTSLRRGMASLVEALVEQLPSTRLHTSAAVAKIENGSTWNVTIDEFAWNLSEKADERSTNRFDHLILATSLHSTRHLLRGVAPNERLREQLPHGASSAILVALTWSAEAAASFSLPQGFGFLVPPNNDAEQLLACTFVDQKFPYRVPVGARVLRAFFGSQAAEQMASSDHDGVTQKAEEQLAAILGPLPPPQHTTVRRWPRSLPQYEVGHLERMRQLESAVLRIPGLTLLGNSYHGVGLPDLIRDARVAARRIIERAGG